MMSAPAPGADIMLPARIGPPNESGAFTSGPPALLVLGAHRADGDGSGMVVALVRASRRGGGGWSRDL